MNITIYHNSRCSNSRKALGIIEDAGFTPHIIHYIETPPDIDTLRSLLKRAGAKPLDFMRTKDPLYTELKLDKDGISDEDLIATMVANPSLINRPIVVTDRAVKLCRPGDTVIELLP